MENKLVGTVRYKSPYAYYIVSAAGLGLLLINENTTIKIFGAVLIVMTLINRFLVKDYSVMSVFDNHIVIDPEGKKTIINNDEIAEWNTNSQGQYAVYIRKTDGTSAFFRTFDTIKASEYLKKTLPDKSTFKMTMSGRIKKEDGFFHALKNKIRNRKN